MENLTERDIVLHSMFVIGLHSMFDVGLYTFDV